MRTQMARNTAGRETRRSTAQQAVAGHIVHVAVVARIQPAHQVLLVLRKVEFCHSQTVKTQPLCQLLELDEDCRQGGGCKLGRAGHGGSV